jgi:hypothetical protein
MQATIQWAQRSYLEFVLLVLVAVLGVSFGRWVIPADDSGSASPSTAASAADAARSEHILDVKFAQMDASDAASAPVPPVSNFTSISEAARTALAEQILDVKFAQMDAADAEVHVAVLSTREATESAADAARSRHILDVKFAQMGAEGSD